MRTKLLLADDSITIQKVVGIIFASEDYELAIVDNGDAALAKARESKPDVLLLDAVMPGKSGYEVCEQIRRDSALKDIPILLLTGAFEPFDEKKARESGADDFIAKPFESQHLIDKVMILADLNSQRTAAAPAPVTEAVSFDAAASVKVTGQVPSVPVPPVPAAETVTAPASAVAPDFFALVEEAVPSEAVAAAPARVPEFQLEVVEGSADDDLWGAFELEDLAEEESPGAEESPFEVEVLSAGAEESTDPFVFSDAEAPAAEAVEPRDFNPKWEPVAENEFSFAENGPSSAPEIAADEQFDVFEEEVTPTLETVPESSVDFFADSAEPATPEFYIETSVPDQDDVFAASSGPDMAGFDEFAPPHPPAESEIDFEFAAEEEYQPVSEAMTAFTVHAPPAAASATPGLDLQFAPEEEYMPAPEALVPVPPPASAPAAPAGAALSDDQLAELVSRISRDIIEKIAWEVVPDLAERIIMEEIRKIKEGV
jgi:CheY-like chemotaxis protein